MGTPLSGEEAGWAGLQCSQGPGLWWRGPKSGLEAPDSSGQKKKRAGEDEMVR